ncbi:hypothetical protein CGH94_24890 [Vibrio parahaemolyticus]|nr:hypothetical protein CGK23_22715 [Vibrio parahaemolyticus]TOL61872.1 hypothetical protein CGH94_24890 [Vibrio parahaemolyticus]
MRSSDFNNSAKETQFLPNISQHQRNSPKVRNRKGEIKAKTSHLVPPERT